MPGVQVHNDDVGLAYAQRHGAGAARRLRLRLRLRVRVRALVLMGLGEATGAVGGSGRGEGPATQTRGGGGWREQSASSCGASADSAFGRRPSAVGRGGGVWRGWAGERPRRTDSRPGRRLAALSAWTGAGRVRWRWIKSYYGWNSDSLVWQGGCRCRRSSRRSRSSATSASGSPYTHRPPGLLRPRCGRGPQPAAV